MSLTEVYVAEKDVTLRRSIVFLMSAACGIVVANLYYIQPLLGELARAFHVSETSIYNDILQLLYT